MPSIKVIALLPTYLANEPDEREDMVALGNLVSHLVSNTSADGDS